MFTPEQQNQVLAAIQMECNDDQIFVVERQQYGYTTRQEFIDHRYIPAQCAASKWSLYNLLHKKDLERNPNSQVKKYTKEQFLAVLKDLGEWENDNGPSDLAIIAGIIYTDKIDIDNYEGQDAFDPLDLYFQINPDDNDPDSPLNTHIAELRKRFAPHQLALIADKLKKIL